MLFHRRGFCGLARLFVTFGGSGGMMTTARTELPYPCGIRTQLLPLNGRTRYGYTYTQNSSPIYWGVNLTNHVELLLLMSVWLDCCLSFQEMLYWWRYLVISGI